MDNTVVRKKVGEIFETWSPDEDGCLTRKDFNDMLKMMGHRDKEDRDEMLSVLDPQERNRLPYKEFLDFIFGPESQQSETDSVKAAETSKRFKLGTRVECRTGPDEWSVGRIIALDYRADDWPPGETVPYQVELDDGDCMSSACAGYTGGACIYVPADVAELCRKYVPAWWKSFFDFIHRPGSHLPARFPTLEVLHKACLGRDVNAKDRQGVAALHEAVRCNWRSGVLELLEMKADVNVADNNQVRALHICVQHGAEMMDVLLKAKADPNCQDKNPDYDPKFKKESFGDRIMHRTPLHYCCEAAFVPSRGTCHRVSRCGRTDCDSDSDSDCEEGLEEQAKMLAMLIQAKADLDIQDGQGKTSLHLAIEEDHSELVDILLQSKADVNLGNKFSNMENSPLIDAAHKGQCDVALKLISARADINKKGKQGMSALHFAARRGCTKMVQILMEADADASQTSDLGTALDLAKKNGRSELLKLLGVTSVKDLDDTFTDLDDMQRKALFLE